MRVFPARAVGARSELGRPAFSVLEWLRLECWDSMQKERQMRILVLLAVMAAFHVAPTAADAQFEGVVTGTLYGDGNKSVGDFTQYVRGTSMRWDMETPGGEVSSIIDGASGTMTSLMHAQKMYMSVNFGEAAASAQTDAAPKPPKFTKTGQTETIAGHTCEHYLVGDAQDLDICAAKGLGMMGFAGGASQGPFGMGRGMPSMPSGYEALAKEFKDGFFPLKMESLRGQKRSLRMIVNGVESKKLEDDLFKVPPGYQEFKMPGFQPPKP
jgi:hypothetical protein